MPLNFHVLLLITLGTSAAATACTRGKMDREKRDASDQSTRATAPPIKVPAAPLATAIDWGKYRAYQALPSYVAPGQSYCTAQVAMKLDTRQLYRVDETALVEIPDVEGVPRGYSNFWHDGCLARVQGPEPTIARPRDLSPYRAPTLESFRRLVAPNTSVYWMSEEGKQCVRVPLHAFDRPHRRRARDAAHSDPSLEAFASLPVPPDAVWGRMLPFAERDPWIPFAAMPPRPGSHGYVLTGTWQAEGGKPFLKCQCERLLRIMRLDDEEIHMLPRRLPGDPDPQGSTVRSPPQGQDEVAYYDSAEVERWFWDQASCDQARIAANARIAQDGRLAPRSGFYSGYSEFD